MFGALDLVTRAVASIKKHYCSKKCEMGANVAENEKKSTGASKSENNSYSHSAGNAHAESSVQNTTSVTDEILKLKSLLDSGILTQKEFDKQKEKLLTL